MPRGAPSYRLHKPTGQAVVTLNGRDFYLGAQGTNASRQRYHRLLAEWEANGRKLPEADAGAPDGSIELARVVLAYWRHAKARYRRADGTPSSALSMVQQAIVPVRRLYGRTPACEFGPLGLRTVRQQYLDRGMRRSTVNKYLRRVKHMFKWAASQQMIPVEIYHALATVEGLRAGEQGVEDTEPVRSLPEAHIAAVKPHVSRQVWGLIRLQLCTALARGNWWACARWTWTPRAASGRRT